MSGEIEKKFEKLIEEYTEPAFADGRVIPMESGGAVMCRMIEGRAHLVWRHGK